MRILIFSWEYPPHVVGGLGQHVAELLPALGNLPGLELHLVTPRWAGGQPVERLGSVTVHRVDPPALESDFYTTAWQTNLRLEKYSQQLWAEAGPFDADPCARLAGGICWQCFEAQPQSSPVKHHPRHRTRPRSRLSGQRSGAGHQQRRVVAEPTSRGGSSPAASTWLGRSSTISSARVTRSTSSPMA